MDTMTKTAFQLTFAEALKQVNQYASSSDRGYMPARTPLPHTMRHVSCGTVPFLANLATPLQCQMKQLESGSTTAPTYEAMRF